MTIASNDRIKSIAFNTSDGCCICGAMIATAFLMRTCSDVPAISSSNQIMITDTALWKVKSVNPDAEFMHNFINSYSDTSIAYEMAIQQQAAGCKFVLAMLL